MHSSSAPTGSLDVVGGCGRSLPGGASRTVLLESDLTSPARARRVVVLLCESVALPADVIDRAELLAGEAVTNAVVHAGGRPCLTVTANAAGVSVSVVDASCWPPRRDAAGPDALRGRGVALLDDCADCWGWRALPFAEGKVVWFDVHAAPAGGAMALRASRGAGAAGRG